MDTDCILLGTSLIILTFLAIGLFAYVFISTLIGDGVPLFVNLIIALFVFTVFTYANLDTYVELNKCLKNGEYNGRNKKRV